MILDLNRVKTMYSLESRVAVVTGGCGAIGKDIATCLALYGADIAICDQAGAEFDEVVKSIEALGQKALPVVCDVTKEDEVINMVEQILKVFGRIDILFPCAGIARRIPTIDMPLAEWELVMDINVKGTFLCCKHIGKTMVERGYGRIINISSTRAETGHAGGYSAYGPSKAAVSGLTKQLAVEWAPYNVTVNAIAPTVVITPLTKQIFDDTEAAKFFLNRIPMGRPGNTEDLMGMVVCLASQASSFVTGQIIFVDGGYTAS